MAAVMSIKTGSLEAAFTDACGEEGTPAFAGATVEQLDLLRDEDGRLPADVFRKIRQGPGRRPGSRNRRSTDLAKLICQKNGNPVLFMASIYSTPLDQLVEMLMAAEGVPEREHELLSLIDRAAMLMEQAAREGWGAERLKAIAQMVESVERAAASLKSKPGEIALKALAHQLSAAREVSAYTDSKKPIEANVNHKVDAVIFMGAGAPNDPAAQAMLRTHEAINSGVIDTSQIEELRFDAQEQMWVPRSETEADDGDDA